MSVARRLVPCLDVRDGRVVKGVCFEGIRDAGDPVECARRYDRDGADEIIFLDITATHEARGVLLDVIARTAEVVFVPLTVGGGVRARSDVDALLRAGADKVSVNSAAVSNPRLIDEISGAYGRQALVVAVDAKRASGSEHKWSVFTHGGRRDTGIDALAWCEEVVRRGAGEILLTSMDRDGTATGYDLELISAVVGAVGVPVIASGGAGTLEHLAQGVRPRKLGGGGADAALAATIFHDGHFTLRQARDYLRAQGLTVRDEPAV